MSSTNTRPTDSVAKSSCSGDYQDLGASFF